MIFSNLYKFFTVPSTRATHFRTLFWFTHSLTLAAIYASLALGEAFSSEYVVQDDARQHVFWMMRFTDPTLFPKDLIADYFQSVAPPGYTFLYWIAAYLGIPPLVLNKILPFVLGLLTTAYTFGVSMQFLPIPFAGFCSTAILNLSLWMRNDLVSGTPRSFVYPLFVAFVYYLLKRQTVLVWMILVLTGLFYPQYLLLDGVILVLSEFKIGFKKNIYLINSRLLKKTREPLKSNCIKNHKSFSFNLDDIWKNLTKNHALTLGGLGISAIVLLPYLLTGNPFDPPISVEEAKTYPEFWTGGRNAFFDHNFDAFWLFGERSGLIPKRTPAILWVGLGLPWLYRYRHIFSLGQKIQGKIAILLPITLSSSLLFVAAHIFLFRLHLPSRYTIHSAIVALALVSGITLVVLLEAVLRWSLEAKGRFYREKQHLGIWITGILVASIVLYPITLEQFPRTSYQVGTHVDLYQFFKEQPPETLIASLEPEADNLPTFSQRSVLVAEEYSIAYHTGYYHPFRQRLLELIRAQYSPSLDPMKQLIQKYGVDFLVINKLAFKPNYILQNVWLNGLRTSIAAQNDELAASIQDSLEFLQAGNIPALAHTFTPCSIYQTSSVLVLEGKCIAKISNLPENYR